MVTCTCTTTHPSLTEEMILNYDVLPPNLKGWRRFRIEYGFECRCPEGLIYLPPNVDPDKIEDMLQPEDKSINEFWNMS